MVSEYADLSIISIEPYLVDGNRLLGWLGRSKAHIGEWHSIKPEYWIWDDIIADEYPLNLISYIDKLTYHNYIIWHQEEHCRTGLVDEIAAAKPLIDRHNQARNDLIETIDDLLIQHEQKPGVDAPYNSETVGSLIDRITILQLKLYHLIELDPTGCRYLSRLNVLLDQHTFLSAHAAQLLNQVRKGERHIKVFRQLKTYNCELNQHWNPQYWVDK